jgi:hypothetical protein
VVAAVPGQERHPAAGYLPDGNRVARRAERRVERDLFGIFAELIEARTADDGDLRQVCHDGLA